jgi:hypothetical protein
MMLLTQDAVLVCQHLGSVAVTTSQSLVTIGHRIVLVEPDPQGRKIDRCPMRGLNVKECSQTLAVEKGYSTLLRIDGHRICLDSVTGKTNGTAPGLINYVVRHPGQDIVSEAA